MPQKKNGQKSNLLSTCSILRTHQFGSVNLVAASQWPQMVQWQRECSNSNFWSGVESAMVKTSVFERVQSTELSCSFIQFSTTCLFPPLLWIWVRQWEWLRIYALGLKISPTDLRLNCQLDEYLSHIVCRLFWSKSCFDKTKSPLDLLLRKPLSRLLVWIWQS